MILSHWYVLIIIVAIVLIFYGPGKIPQVGGAIGKALREFRKASSEAPESTGAPKDVTAESSTEETKNLRH